MKERQHEQDSLTCRAGSKPAALVPKGTHLQTPDNGTAVAPNLCRGRRHYECATGMA